MKSNLQKNIFIFVLMAISTGTQSASFDCQKARSVTEKLICQDEELSRLDEELASIYKNSISKSEFPKDLIANQKNAWKQREAECSTKSCLIDWYAQRKTFFGAESAIRTNKIVQSSPEKRKQWDGRPHP